MEVLFLSRWLSIPQLSLATVAILCRQLSVQVLGIVTGVVLARNLSISDFGIYSLLTFQFYLHLSIGDLGFGASVVRQEEDPELPLLRMVFSTRIILDILQCIAVWFLAPLIAGQYGYQEELVNAFRLVACAVLVQSIQVIPTVLLERSLCFGRLATIEIVQAIVFSLVCIYTAVEGRPLSGFGLAWLLHAATGAILCLLIRPWPVGVGVDFKRLRARVAFALPYQGVHMATLARESLTPVVVGMLAGAAALGKLSWANALALSFATSSLALQRVFLPALARNQRRPDLLATAIQKNIFLSHTLIAPLAMLILLLQEPVTRIVFGEQWLAALPLMQILWLANLALPFLAPVLSLFNALGKSSAALRYTVEISVASWVLGVPLLLLFGLPGYAFSIPFVHALVWLLIRRAQKLVAFRAWRPAMLPWILNCPPALLLMVICWNFSVSTLWHLLALGLLYGATYGLLLFVFRARLIAYVAAESDGVSLPESGVITR